MHPYLERPNLWPNFHNSFIAVARDQLVPRLRPNFFVGIEERVYMLDEEIREARLEILDVASRKIVAVIEVVSPANMIEGVRGRKSNNDKRVEIMNSPCHLVEIDLLRKGK